MYPGITRTSDYAVKRLSAPSGQVTNTAPTTRAAMTLSVRPGKFTADRIWGSLPTEHVEGHAPDPAYDVRPIEGLGWAPIRSEQLARARAGLGLSRDLDAVQQAQSMLDRSVARPSAVIDAAAASPEPSSASPTSSSMASLGGLATMSPEILMLLGALGLFFALKRR